MKVFVNILSGFRIAAAFGVIPFLLLEYFDWAFAVFVLAAATDWLDGFLARKFKAQTKLGGVLDQIGDKFLIVNTLVMVTMFLQIWPVLAPSMIMISRELYVSGLREFMGTRKMEMGVPKDKFAMGKIKTATQFVSLAAILLWVWAVNADWQSEFLTYYLLFGGIGGLWVALLASLASAAQYTVTFAKNLKKIK
ncbi:MAG: CDP-alcohol phosphatidyltransferase family protein [Rickettsiales bacterium]|jgi:CDP-diacylglycerol--glycerol-3-phosphate 3-phosphatidyltransferase|nr:CDP-alcohol phosphatidyltransferase family protein [Rickettsiales bacterium]